MGRPHQPATRTAALAGLLAELLAELGDGAVPVRRGPLLLTALLKAASAKERGSRETAANIARLITLPVR